MKLKNFLLPAIMAMFISACTNSDSSNTNNQNVEEVSVVDDNMKFADQQLSLALKAFDNSKKNPRNTEKNGEVRLVPSKDWTSGFFPGNLWYMYEYTKDEKWKTAAEHYTMNVEDQQFNAGTHDMGFKMFCSFGNGYRLTNNENYKNILVQSAKTLITRYNPTVGCIRSWDFNKDKWDFPVIIDNMLNLELLFWASKATGDSTYYNIAYSHASTTLKNHFREDHSSYHVIDYDTITGEVRNKHTHQGYAHESAWARGQGWGIYGYTMCYRETGDEKFLVQAENIANYILNNKTMPEDLIPYWDFLAPGIPNEPRDASAAGVICSGLYELSIFSKTNGEKYKAAADKMLESLSSEQYRAKVGENNHFLLMHSTGHKPDDSEVDVPIIYADYYFLEANLRKQKIENN